MYPVLVIKQKDMNHGHVALEHRKCQEIENVRHRSYWKSV